MGEIKAYFNDRSDLPFLKVGQPYLVDETNMALFEEPTEFLHSEFAQSGRRRSTGTWESGGRNLALWFNFLAAANIDWRLATRDDLIAFRDAHYTTRSPQTGEYYADVTVRNRMLTVLAYYRFCSRRGWYEGTLHTEDLEVSIGRSSLDRTALSHTRAGAGRTRIRNELVVKARRTNHKVRPFSKQEWLAFIEVLGPLPTHSNSRDPRMTRNRLIAEVAVWTGLRLESISKLAVLQFLGLNPDPASPFAHQLLTVLMKGRKRHTIQIPNWLVIEVQHYIEHERARGLRKAGRLDLVQSGELFLGEADGPNSARPIGRRRYQQIVEEACVKAGLIYSKEFVDPVSGEKRVKTLAKHSFHDTRHTYAVWKYFAEVAAGNPEPWKKIQAQLGHESLETTTDIYLQFVNVFDGFEAHRPTANTIG